MPPMPPLSRRHFGTVFETALACWPDKVAVRDADHWLTYRQLHGHALRMAGGFSQLQVARQENVLLMLDNHVDFVVCWSALSLTARVEVPVNTAYMGALLAHLMNNSQARVVVIESHYVSRLNDVADQLTFLEHVVVRGQGGDAPDSRWKACAWEELSRGDSEEAAALRPSDVMAILYTSGTTGPSKGSVNSHAHGFTYSHPSVNGAAQHDDIVLVPLPLFHMGGQWQAVYNALISGATAVILPKFSGTRFWEQAQQYGATYCFLLGSMSHFLLKQPARPTDRGHALKSMLLVPVPLEIDEFKARFGVERIGTAFGSTEAGIIAHAPLGTAVAGHAGWLRAGVEAIVVDEHGNEVAPGDTGEIWARAREPWTMMNGYFGMPEASAAVSQNFWFHTGDAVRVAPGGQFIFVDRVKDSIRRRGENVSSFEVEREIHSHPAVAECAVVGVPSEYAEDEIKACVVCRAGADVTAGSLVDFLAARLPRFAVPRYVEFFTQLPKTPTEKVKKGELKARGITASTWDREHQPQPPVSTPATAGST